MIVVSGTGRSGTSLWMQVLARCGVPIIGEKFPLEWSSKLGSLNPRGFYESTLVQGINFTTNPNPVTGARLFPDETRGVAVKVFTFGVRRTDRQFLDRVLVTIRHWADFTRSLERLWELDHKGQTPIHEVLPVHPAVWWFQENLDLVRDARSRGYPLRFAAFERTLTQPREVVGEVLEWLELSPFGEAADAVVPDLETPFGHPPRPNLPAHWLEGLEELYARLAEEGSLARGELERLWALRLEMEAQGSLPT